MHHINNPHPSFRPLATSFQTSGDPVAPCKMVVRAGSVLTPPQQTNLLEQEKLTQQTPAPAVYRSGQVRSGEVRSGQVRSGQVRSRPVPDGLTTRKN